MSIILHGVFLFLLFLMFFWLLNSIDNLHDKVDQIPGTDAGVAVILAQLRADRESVHTEIEQARWQMDPMNQSLAANQRTLHGYNDRLERLLGQYDSLVAIVEKLATRGVDSVDDFKS